MDINAFLEFFGSFAAFAGGVVVVTQFLNQLFNVKAGWAQQLISWLTSMGMAALGYGMQWGYLAALGTPDQWQGWVMAGVAGFGAGLASNGLYDIKIVQTVVEWIWSFIRKKPETINE